MKTIREKENELFERWNNSQGGFIPDGVVDETAWGKAEKKILFLLREVKTVLWDLMNGIT